MKNIKVKLNSFTPSEVVINAVGMPYDITNPTIDVVNRVIGINHHDSVAEHIVFNFTINGISRACLQETSRHRMSSPTVKSTRFSLNKTLKRYGELYLIECDMDEPETDEDLRNEIEKMLNNNFLIPNKLDTINEKIYKEYIEMLQMHNENSLEYMRFCKDELKLGADYYKYFLTENLKTKLSWTINLRSLINFFNLRLDSHAHFEIRHLANMIKSEVCRVPYVKHLLKMIDEHKELVKKQSLFWNEIKSYRDKYIINKTEDHYQYIDDICYRNNVLDCIEKYFGEIK